MSGISRIKQKLNVRTLSEITLYILGIGLALLILYFADSFYDDRDRHAVLVLGLCIAIYYVTLIKRQFTSLSADAGEEVAPIHTELSPRSKAIISRIFGSGLSSMLDRLKALYVRFVRPTMFLVFAIFALATMVYVYIHFDRLKDFGPTAGYETLDYAVGVIVIYLSTDVTIRSFGWAMGSIVPIGYFYGYFGPYLPGVLFHTGLSPEHMIRITVLGMSGVYGFILEIGATWVAVFLLLAGLAKGYGILDYLMDVSREVSKLFKTGIVHSAVLASLGFGSITGASAANTATTGSFTIPMMKNQGVGRAHAGGIETVASIGGQLVPPIMGIAAFIMADFVGVPYVDIIQAGLIPAILFYFSVVIAVHLLVYKHDWTTKRDVENIDWDLLKVLLWYAFPFGLLVYLLAVLQWSPLLAGLYTVLALIGVEILRYALNAQDDLQSELGNLLWYLPPVGAFLTLYAIDDYSLFSASVGGFLVLTGVALVQHVTQGESKGPGKAVTDTARGLKIGSEEMAPLLVILGAIGIIIAVFTQTGFAQRLNFLMLNLAGDQVVLLLILAMFVSLIFGLGMPAPAAYVIVASLAVTAMTRFGIEDIIAHMFVFYFAMYSSLTPPVGPSTIIAAKIANASYWDTAIQAGRIALPGFLIPFVFVANRELIIWEFPTTIIITISMLVFVVSLSVSIFGFDGTELLSGIGRVFFAGMALLGFFGVYVGVLTVSTQFGLAIVLAALITMSHLPSFPFVAQIQDILHAEKSITGRVDQTGDVGAIDRDD